MNRAESIAEGLHRVRAQIADAEQAAHRSAGSVQLVAVSKKMPADDVIVARSMGQLDFGENYAQELRDKRAAIADLMSADEAGANPGTSIPRWHYIGPLQSNKVKYLAGLVHLIHSVDSPAILLEIERRTAALELAMTVGTGSDVALAVPHGGALTQKCLVQVNVAGELQKGGVTPNDLPALLDAFSPLSHVACVGLMLIPPFSEDAEDTRRYFSALRELARREQERGRQRVDLRELSMGMSHDFPQAVAEGATMIRVGTAIFGERPAPPPSPSSV